MDRMTEQAGALTEHLLELRARLLRIFAVILVLCLGLLPFANDIYRWVATPLLNALPFGSQMIATDIASPFLTPFKLTVVAAFFIAVPYVLAELWGFLAPALYRKEKKLLLPVLLSSVSLFYAGMAFVYFAVFPVIFSFFSLQSPEGVLYAPDINAFFNTALKLLIAFGLAFEIPVITVVLAYTGTIDPANMAKKRPFVIVGCFVLGMLLTPPDPLSQAMMAIPMWLLFETGLLLAKLPIRRSRAAG